MDDIRHRLQARSAESAPAAVDRMDDDLEGHSATIYRRRRGPYPLRAAALPEADDRVRRGRDPRNPPPTL